MQCVCLVALPKNRISEAAEKVNAPFESSITEEFSQKTLATLLLVFTRIKPTVKISNLRVRSYDQLCDLMVKANTRLVVSMHHVKHEAMVGELGTTPTAETINELCANLATEFRGSHSLC